MSYLEAILRKQKGLGYDAAKVKKEGPETVPPSAKKPKMQPTLPTDFSPAPDRGYTQVSGHKSYPGQDPSPGPIAEQRGKLNIGTQWPPVGTTVPPSPYGQPAAFSLTGPSGPAEVGAPPPVAPAPAPQLPPGFLDSIRNATGAAKSRYGPIKLPDTGPRPGVTRAEDPAFSVQNKLDQLERYRQMGSDKAIEYFGEFNREPYDEVRERLRQASLGLTGDEYGAMRGRAMSGLESGLATNLRDLRASQAASGVRGAAAQAGTADMLRQGQQQRSALEEALLAKDIDYRRQGLADYDSALRKELATRYGMEEGHAGLGMELEGNVQAARTSELLRALAEKYHSDAEGMSVPGMWGPLEDILRPVTNPFGDNQGPILV